MSIKSKKPIFITKFGGSSLADEERRMKCALRVKELFNEGILPVAVVSAIGRKPSPYSTDVLISLAEGLMMSSREMDMLMSCGENISAAIFSMTLSTLGLRSRALTGWQAGILTDDNHNNARIVQINTWTLEKLLMDEIVPVICGYQGINLNGEITTLGRGGSDISAVALGIALKSSEVRIYSDVDGIYTSDPKIYSEAGFIREISVNELINITNNGAAVMNPIAAALASGMKEMKLKFLGYDGRDMGTEVMHSHNFDYPYPVTAVTHISDLVQFKVLSESDKEKDSEIIFREVSSKDISLDMFSYYDGGIMFCSNKGDLFKIADILKSLGANFCYKEGLSKLSVIGESMRGMPGIMYRIVSSINRIGAKIYQSVDSHTTISILVEEGYLGNCIIVLCREFGLDWARSKNAT